MDGFASLQKCIERLVRIKCSNYKEDYIKRRILSRMRLTNTEDYEAYQKYLLTHPEEIDLLRKALTINVTKFFRDPDVFEVIQQKILPDLARHKKLIRIWCAGCATGEEPYSIAILAHELMALHRDLNVTIYATDIDTEALQKAMAGIYDLKALENVDKHRIRRHFISRDDGTFEVCPHLRELVKFRQHDLMSGVPVARYLDIVVCRNVTIYFTEKQKNELTYLFHTALSTDGYYVMGKTEYLGREVEHLFTPYSAVQKILRKAT
ncbi:MULTISPECIES: protein-glutamate O-methyltransferase CheR [Methanoculleus]|jgi:chemotaxis protein methyltransferase CheR|uniref:protein-glutamate O-methyltransferase n=1 Tax=Methanoculleus thermophilus TaxID=2200 RepID=A0A1G8YUB7_9EURY|nr:MULTISPECIES: protein-glutamate O-methyltransferase CheR [Methanoculleus]NLN08627.1 protein-glutamate O-methyltransferase CheR [Methanoculleus thermophilus]SDK06373.1 chemotaxis protein methyltransferase CheR [Methanoculleus thermophilus]HQD24910.1 protein-glutamate O-methyltransferase CheR [Methanoculleus thermophilus]